jgi:phosphoribosyl 1,2-cyclic phosphate phosphodiesterase
VSAAVRDVELIVLGSGTSAGVPAIGCDCEVCTSDDPRDRRLRCSSCLRFVDADGQERTILLDASPDLREQALRHRLRRSDAILFTHHHVDHVFGLDEVRRFNLLMRAPIDVYGEPRTLEALGRIYKHIFEQEKNVNDSFVATLIPHLLEPGLVLDLFGLRVTPLRLLHGRLPILGFRVEALDAAGDVADEQPGPLPLGYCTDVSSIPPESWGVLGGLRNLLLDMLRPRHHPTHLTVDQAVAAADQIGAERTWFVHMTHDILHADLDPRLPEGMGLAWDGLRLV